MSGQAFLVFLLYSQDGCTVPGTTSAFKTGKWWKVVQTMSVLFHKKGKSRNNLNRILLRFLWQNWVSWPALVLWRLGKHGKWVWWLALTNYNLYQMQGGEIHCHSEQMHCRSVRKEERRRHGTHIVCPTSINIDQGCSHWFAKMCNLVRGLPASNPECLYTNKSQAHHLGMERSVLPTDFHWVLSTYHQNWCYVRAELNWSTNIMFLFFPWKRPYVGLSMFSGSSFFTFALKGNTKQVVWFDASTPQWLLIDLTELNGKFALWHETDVGLQPSFFSYLLPDLW